MREFNTSGLSKEALAQVYEIVLTQKLCLEAKLERMKKELAVASCAIEDGKIKDLEQTKNGMMNLIAYAEAKIDLSDELDMDNGSLELIDKHIEAIKKYELNKNKKLGS